MALGIEDLKTRSASADVGERFHRDIRLLAQLLHRLVNCAGGSAGALLGVLGLPSSSNHFSMALETSSRPMKASILLRPCG